MQASQSPNGSWRMFKVQPKPYTGRANLSAIPPTAVRRCLRFNLQPGIKKQLAKGVGRERSKRTLGRLPHLSTGTRETFKSRSGAPRLRPRKYFTVNL